jgi:hypothetical protein
LDKRLGGPQSHSGRGGEEKNSQPPPGIEPQNPDRPSRSPALYRLSYYGPINEINIKKILTPFIFLLYSIRHMTSSLDRPKCTGEDNIKIDTKGI